ncbi:nucleotidyl transferase AbiEii/AbiGii toxin family protein [Larkinella soli]|uniref:nucleotidyl transferase AbiEii/AbiGii toxin family protein n=1 Tax=Larkinella soli TaxID=1770527 RepID=UPI000FFC81A0|nr:nucleotidyl transferase AbiEii/AbiGii toxin family protein [Larkinella soli]
MLHTETVAEPTLDLLKRLSSIPELAAFALVGGTNLSLRFGHRMSVDLDFFTSNPFDLFETQEILRENFPTALQLYAGNQTLQYFIEGVKVDLILHKYPYLQPIDTVDGIRLTSLPAQSI